MPESASACAVIMAGGHGIRFWPASRRSRPKQFLKLLGHSTFIERTLDRIAPLFKRENIFVVTSLEYSGAMKKILTSLPAENIIAEPEPKDTAPCIALAAAVIRKRFGGENVPVCIFPSDAVVNDNAGFRRTVRNAIAESRKRNAVTLLGVKPSFPCTGYGYIELSGRLRSGVSTRFFKAAGFKEKPSLEIAEEYISSGKFRWNAGIFISPLNVFENSFREYAPELAALEKRFIRALDRGESLAKIYASAKKESIDFAVMEKLSEKLIVADSDFDWDDAGTWSTMRNQLKENADGNILRGTVTALDAENCIIESTDDHLVAALDVNGIVIVHTPDATLVCSERSAQRVKQLVDILAKNKKTKRFI